MKNHLYFKLQSIPDYSDKALELYFKKYQDVNNLASLEEAKEDFYKNGSKNPIFGKIHSITVGFENGDEIRTTVLRGSEKDIIAEFLNITNGEFFQRYKMTSWNFAFVLPFLRIRAAKNGIKTNFVDGLQDLSKKAWTITGLDLFDSWKGLGWFSSSLEEVAELTFNIPTNFIDGEDIYKYFQEGKLDELDQSAINEMVTLINVHQGIMKEDFIEKVSSTVKIIEDVKEVEVPILNKLYNTKSFNKEVRDYLIAAKILKKDKPTVEKLVLAHYLEQIDVMAQNKKELTEINKTRTEEVKEFFKTL